MLSNTFLWSGSKVSLGWLQSHGVLHDPFSGPIHFNILVQILKRDRIKMKTSLPIFWWAYVLQIGKVFRILYFSRPWIFPVTVSTWHLWTQKSHMSSPHISSQPAKWGKCLRGLWLFARLLCLQTWILGVCWSSHSVNKSLLADSTNVWYECAIWASLSSVYSGYISSLSTKIQL